MKKIEISLLLLIFMTIVLIIYVLYLMLTGNYTSPLCLERSLL